MIQAVLDNETLVSGLAWHGSPAKKVVGAALAGRFVPITSPELLAQLERVLNSPGLAPFFPDTARIVTLVREMSIVIDRAGSRRVVAGQDANHLLALAGAAQAEFLVTTDYGLLRLGQYGDSKIVRPHWTGNRP